MLNNEWILTAGHCLEFANVGTLIQVLYTDTSGFTSTIRTTFVAERFRDPDYVEFEDFEDS